jgi:hypothetical protein
VRRHLGDGENVRRLAATALRSDSRGVAAEQELRLVRFGRLNVACPTGTPSTSASVG